MVGVPDLEWGERVAAAVVLKDGDILDLPSLRAWAKEFLAAHKLPSRLLVLDALPRNAMGKVTKPAIAKMFRTATATIRDLKGERRLVTHDQKYQTFRALHNDLALCDPESVECRNRQDPDSIGFRNARDDERRLRFSIGRPDSTKS